MTTTKREEPLRIYLADEHKEFIRSASERTKASMSAIVRDILEKHISNHRDEDSEIEQLHKFLKRRANPHLSELVSELGKFITARRKHSQS